MTEPPRTNFLCPVTIGRTGEIDRLRAFLAGDGGVLLVSGEAGVGKTRLAREARGSAERVGRLVIESRSYEADRMLPFAPALTVLRALIAQCGHTEVVRLAGLACHDLGRLVPELAPDPPRPVSDSVDQQTAKRRLLDGCAEVITRVAAQRPLLLIVEDLHWLDTSGLELLLHLARRAQSDRYQMLMTYRDDEVDTDLEHVLATLDRERLAVEIALHPLDARQIAAMLQAIFGAEETPPASLLHTLYALTEGNPFFVEEVLSALGVDRPFIAPDGAWNRSEPLLPRVPRSIHDAVRNRLNTLGGPARQIVTLAAVAGRRFQFDLLSIISGFDETALLQIMKELIAAQLVQEEPDDQFAFRHALTREAIYAGLLDRERRMLHREMLHALEHLAGQERERHLDDIARHAFAASSWSKALAASAEAGRRAAALQAPRAAAEHFSRAIAAARALGLDEDPVLHRERGRAYETLGDFPRALADYDLALALERTRGNRRAEWLTLLDLSLLWSARDYGRTGQLVTEALSVARELNDPAAIARALNRAGNWHSNIEESSTAIAYHREALAICEELGDERGIAETLDLLGMASMMGADLVTSGEAYTRAAQLSRSLGDRRGEAAALLGLCLQSPNFHTDTLPALRPARDACGPGERSLMLCRDIDWLAGECFVLWGYLGMTLGAAGWYDRAIPATTRALQIAGEIEHEQWMVGARCILGKIFTDVGAWNLALPELKSAREVAASIGSLYWSRSASGWLASCHIAAGELGEAEAVLQGALDETTPMNTIAGRLLWVAAAELDLAQRRPEQALVLVERMTASIPRTAGRAAPRLEHLRGAALLELGRHDEAEAALRSAREHAVWSQAAPLLWRIDGALARLCRRLKRDVDAAKATDKAWATVEQLIATIPEDGPRAALEQRASRDLPLPGGRTTMKSDFPDDNTASSPLSRREMQVATLLTEGLTNREIGDRLFLSEWTVATHVRHILAKLDVSSRAQAAAWAARRTASGED